MGADTLASFLTEGTVTESMQSAAHLTTKNKSAQEL